MVNAGVFIVFLIPHRAEIPRRNSLGLGVFIHILNIHFKIIIFPTRPRGIHDASDCRSTRSTLARASTRRRLER